MRRWIRRIWATCGVLAMVALAWSYEAKGVDPAVLRSDDRVEVVDRGGAIEFTPTSAVRSARLLVLPGGMVEPEAYAPMAHAVASAGYPVVLVRYPFLGRHALTEGQKREVLDRVEERLARSDPNVQWVVAGHSFGCVLGSRLAAEVPDALTSLVLIASTHPRDVDLSGSGIRITKVLGTRDGVASPEKARENRDMLPEDVRWIEIEGANHAQFAYYGPQLGDGRATISREEQQARLIEVLHEELERAGT